MWLRITADQIEPVSVLSTRTVIRNIQVPLCLSVTELFFMTNQSREGEVFYSFVDSPVAPLPEIAPRERAVNQTPFSPHVYHGGLLRFLNSFGSHFPFHDSGSGSHCGDDESSVGLREHLESLLSGHRI
jgi:hypothetical protein